MLMLALVYVGLRGYTDSLSSSLDTALGGDSGSGGRGGEGNF